MTYRSFSLISPLSNHPLSDRFEQIDNLFSRLTGSKPITDIPAYDLIQKNKDHYEMIINVPGYSEDELDISILNNQLTINGKFKTKEINTVEESSNIKWLHNGIKKNNFSLSFNLEHKITIQQANLNKGLLTLEFKYNIPEQEKPQKIDINS